MESASIKNASRHNTNKFGQDHMSTTTFEDNDIDVFRRKIIERSPSKPRNRNQYSGELQPARKSPARLKDQSPGRVRSDPRPDPERVGRGPGFGSTGRQRSASGNLSGARSRSPGKRIVTGGGCSGGRNEIERSLSARRTGKSPGRVGSDLNDRARRPELKSGRVREESNRFTSNSDESLENPLVSLECFIFL
ncbi:hypothetical protein CTI12_AA058860 [Artemisia annua]|uniref:Uncharacterized protein n=1 Tax=Artemisia annua TaxID=35608 RepID=A0A2U1Q1R0_ARTAN|nr:hypothetical protein CTI12_AA058860 [Artemisia annua]